MMNPLGRGSRRAKPNTNQCMLLDTNQCMLLVFFLSRSAAGVVRVAN